MFSRGRNNYSFDMSSEGGGGKKVDHGTITTPTLQRKFVQRNQQSVSVGSDDFILVEDLGPHRKISVKEKVDSVGPYLLEKYRKCFTKKNVYRRLPVLSWLPRYNAEDALGDLVAGVTVGLTVIPQSLAYSNIAGLPAEYGLYGSFMGSFMYILLGSCKDVPMGPTAITALLTYTTLRGMGPHYASLLCFLSGIIQLLMGLAGLGIMIDFISGPVSSGFTSAVAILIIMSQVKDILGVKAAGSTFVEMCISLSKDIQNTRLWDTVLGCACIATLLLLRKVGDVKIGPPDSLGVSRTGFQQGFNKLVWLIGTSRNAIMVVLCGVLGFYLYKPDLPEKDQLLVFIGHIPPGLPTLQAPPFHETKGNVTYSFVDMVSQMGQGVIVLPIIALLENIAICKAFSNGKTVDATQELIAIGLCNIGNSFCQGFPGSGSLSRSAVNNSSGVRTPFGSFYTALLVIVSLLFCTPYFFYIPKTALAAVIIAAVVFMVEVRVVKPIYRSKKSDLIPGIATFIACLVLKLEVGILIGIGLNLISILYHAARPKISMEVLKSRAGVEYLLLTPDRCLIFPSVDYVSNLVTKHSIKQGIPVVIDCSHIYGADFTAAKVIEVLTQDFSRRRQPLFFYNLKPEVVAVFEGIKPKDFVVYYNEHQLDNLLLQHTANLMKIEA